MAKPLYHWTQDKQVSASFLRKIAKELKNSKCILDLGCGNGYNTNLLIKNGFNMYGVDNSEKGLQLAKHQHPDRFFKFDVEQTYKYLPNALKDKQFDTIICLEVIEHLNNPRALMKLIKDILPENGKVIVTTPYYGYLKNLAISILNKWDYHHGPLWDSGHIKFWSQKTLTQLFSEFNLLPRFTGLGRNVPYFWGSIMAVAKKK